jgi:outer membrane protein insertion porin family
MRDRMLKTRYRKQKTILIVLVQVMLLCLWADYAFAAGATDSNGKNVIKSISFVNNHAIKSSTLRKKLDFKVGDYLDPILAEAYRRTIVEFYRKKGYAYVSVSLDGSMLQQGDIVYILNEGPRVKIGSVNFVGNKSIKTSSLRGVVKTKKRKAYFWPRYYVEEVPAEDVARLQDIYYQKGFLDYEIFVKKEITQDRKKVHITFVIDEGPGYAVKKISILGNEYFDDDRLREGLEMGSGEIFNKRKADLQEKKILKLYRENGFMNAVVLQRHRFVPDANVVDVEYSINEGTQFRIGKVDITGNEQTQDKVIRRVLDEYGFLPGQLYNADLAPREGNGDLEKNLQAMTMAEEVIIRPAVPEDKAADRRDVKVSITEGQTGSLIFSGGVSSDSDVIGQVIWEQRNFDISDWPENFGEFISGQAFKGAGQSLRLALEPGTIYSRYSVSFTEPYFRDKPVSLGVEGSSSTREIDRRGQHQFYDEGRDKGYVGFEKRYENKWRRNISFRAENVNINDLYINAPQEVRDFKGYTFLTGVRVGFGRDMRDNRFNPSEGYNYNVGYEQVTGDESFGILEGRYVMFKTLHEDLLERKTVLATKFLGATTLSYAPPFERFYAGGTGTYGIRGFEYRGISTRGLQTGLANPQREDPIGSEWIFLANTEVTVPLVSDTFGALFFVDSGAIDTGGYRASIGAGIQILIPQWSGAVPMRFEFATPFMKDDDDETRVFSFSMRGLF